MTRRVSSRLGLCGVALVALFAALAGYGLAASPGRAPPPFIVIKQGITGPYRWRVFTRREASSLATKYRPCLGVGFSGKEDPSGHFKVFYACGVVEPVPNVVVDSVGTGESLHTVIAVAYGKQAQKVLIDLGSRGVRHLRLALLSKKLARKVHLAQYRYAALDLADHFCIHRIAGFDGSGNVVADDKHATCF
jgi:hypothetical protein